MDILNILWFIAGCLATFITMSTYLLVEAARYRRRWMQDYQLRIGNSSLESPQ